MKNHLNRPHGDYLFSSAFTTFTPPGMGTTHCTAKGVPWSEVEKKQEVKLFISTLGLAVNEPTDTCNGWLRKLNLLMV
ncbi:MAG: hypothetical protein IPQ12_10265 [Polaromonas sp.]|nr:hypothetical protein [Polaromonas sp.]